MLTNPKGPKKGRSVKKIIFVTALYLLYIATLQPLVATLFFPPIVHSGVDCYTENRYLKFEKGEVLQSVLSSIPLPDETEAKQFAYYNHCLRDNLFYGKFCDAYIVDLYIGQPYEVIRKYVTDNSSNCISDGGYEVHLLKDATPTDEDCVSIALFDDLQTVRVILMTNYRAVSAGDIGSILYRKFGVDWIEKVL